ncbi:FAD-binding domain-containing protein [Coxiella-like endosymbiont]|nr:FAD-binding domain-containing protein [Coxiella-like endosymbiont]
MHNRVRIIVASFLVKDLLINNERERNDFGIHYWTQMLLTMLSDDNG